MIISAQEARNKIESLENENIKKQIEEIEKCINKAIDECKYTIYYYEKLYEPVKEKLRELGYTISSCTDPRDHSVTTCISW